MYNKRDFEFEFYLKSVHIFKFTYKIEYQK